MFFFQKIILASSNDCISLFKINSNHSSKCLLYQKYLNFSLNIYIKIYGILFFFYLLVIILRHCDDASSRPILCEFICYKTQIVIEVFGRFQVNYFISTLESCLLIAVCVFMFYNIIISSQLYLQQCKYLYNCH